MSSETFIMHRFDSIHEFVKASERNAVSAAASHRNGKDWHGTSNFAEAVGHAKNGTWTPESLLEFRNLFDGLEAKLRRFVDDMWERRPEVCGGDVNVAAFLEGEPECMFEFLPDESLQKKHALCLIIGHSISGGCTSEELFIRGQAAIALVRALSQLGYELEIWSEETVSGRGGKLPDYFTTLVKLHGAGEIMDESAVEFAVGNPSWLRRLLFGFQEGQPANVRKKFGFIDGCYGICTPIKHAELVGADIQLDLGQSWFSSYNPERAAEDGMRWVVDQLKALGVIDQDAEWEG